MKLHLFLRKNKKNNNFCILYYCILFVYHCIIYYFVLFLVQNNKKYFILKISKIFKVFEFLVY